MAMMVMTTMTLMKSVLNRRPHPKELDLGACGGRTEFLKWHSRVREGMKTGACGWNSSEDSQRQNCNLALLHHSD